jgi:protein-disulfide isomerase
MAKKKEEVITISLEPLLVPLSILLAGLMVATSIYIGFGRIEGGVGSTKSEGPEGPMYDLVEEIGVDRSEFAECYDAGEFESEVQSDLADGSSAGVNGTPGFIVGVLDGDSVDGIQIGGAQAFDTFKTKIEEQLKRAEDSSFSPEADENFPAAQISIDDDPLLGNKDEAKVAVVEFSDFECPYCQRFHQTTYDQIINEFVDNGEVVFVYRDFPLSFHDPVATNAAVAMECVQDMEGDEKAFEFIEAYYENTKTNGSGL